MEIGRHQIRCFPGVESCGQPNGSVGCNAGIKELNAWQFGDRSAPKGLASGNRLSEVHKAPASPRFEEPVRERDIKPILPARPLNGMTAPNLRGNREVCSLIDN